MLKEKTLTEIFDTRLFVWIQPKKRKKYVVKRKLNNFFFWKIDRQIFFLDRWWSISFSIQNMIQWFVVNHVLYTLADNLIYQATHTRIHSNRENNKSNTWIRWIPLLFNSWLNLYCQINNDDNKKNKSKVGNSFFVIYTKQT